MTIPKMRRTGILDKLADHILAHGLTAASLRALAAAAGTSDRMLLYYFTDKSAIITATLEVVIDRLMALLGQAVSATALSPDELLRRLNGQIDEPQYWPFLRLFLEIASRAAQGDAFCSNIGEALGRGFLSWVSAQLDCPDAATQEHQAARVMQALEGMVFLKAIGLDDINHAALAAE
ncbi:MAG: TetR family transcriptional regulator [Parasphingorhabdus sp.]|nr:TetR family transcriptional regulator [Parasphingorhabdus sp.]